MERQDYAQLVDEIRQLRDQYLAEVPGRRRAWPKSIKERVLQLRQLELSYEEISALTGIPAPTIYVWKSQSKAEPGFLPVQVVAEKTPPAPKPVPRQRRDRMKSTSTIIVIAPNGMRFEGLDLRSALAIAREFGSCS